MGIELSLDELSARLRAAGCVFAEEEAALLATLAEDDAQLSALVAARAAGAPLEHLVGFVEFRGMRYRLGPGTFIPRQRSALLVEEAIRRGGSTILDLCCGCGALGLATQAEIGGQLIAADISPIALGYARANGVEQAYLGDLFDALPSSYRQRFDLIIANAPYVPSGSIAGMPRESRDFEPPTTVDGGPDGMHLQRRILAAASDWLSPGGALLTETSRAQQDALATEARSLGWRVSVIADTGRGAHIVVVEL